MPTAAAASPAQTDTEAPTASPPPAVSGEGSTLTIDLPDDSIEAIGITPTEAVGNWETSNGSGTVGSTVEGLTFVAVTDSDGTSVVAEFAQPLPTGSVDFEVALPPGHSLQAEDGGSIAVVAPDGVSTSGFAPPWAIDSEGNHLATSYSLEGDTITQHIATDSDTNYPVLADPKFTTGYVTGTVYFNIPETNSIANAGSVAGACGAFGAFGLPWGPILAAACAASWGIYVWVARNARDAGKCLKVKFNLFGPPTPVPQTYSGGYCTK